jgi:hypothetical protein
LDRPVAGRHWKASPATRMMELLHSTDVRLGLVTNGEHWMLVDAPRGDTTGFASWYTHLWLEERLPLRPLHQERTLLGTGREEAPVLYALAESCGRLAGSALYGRRRMAVPRSLYICREGTERSLGKDDWTCHSTA